MRAMSAHHHGDGVSPACHASVYDFARRSLLAAIRALCEVSAIFDLNRLFERIFVVGCVGSVACSQPPPAAPIVPQDPSACFEPPSHVPLSTASEGIPSQGLLLWLRADVGIAVDYQNRVCLWKDQSGNRFDVKQDKPALRPKAGASLNGRPAINVDPGQTLRRDDVLGLDAASGRTFVAVYALDSVSTRFSPIMQGNPGTNNVFLGLDDNTYSTAGNLYGCYAPDGQAFEGNIKTDAKPHVRTLVVDSLQLGRPTNETVHCRVDSAEMKLVYRCCDSSMRIGDFRTANTTTIPHAGDATLAEVLMYDHPLTSDELAKLENHLEVRYVISH